MKACRWFAGCVLVFLFVTAGCSSKKSANPAVGGKITAQARIISQSGNVYSVQAYDYDWYPGAVAVAVARVGATTIDGGDYSSTAILDSVGAGGKPTTVAKTFNPGEYSVVFFVSVPGSPPQHFAEVRVKVDGDITASAPPWADWTHM